MRDITVSQIGCGYWGPNLLRAFSSQSNCEVRWLAEQSPKRQAYVRENFPKTQVTDDWMKVINDPSVDAVIVATPAASHYEIARAALLAGKHVLVEKPVATNVEQAEDLARLSRSQKRVLMVGHTFLYNPAVRFLKEYLDKGELGQIYYIYCQRLNLGQVRSDVNVWWNLAPHDISILLYLMNGKMPVSLTSSGKDYIQKKIEDVIFATLTWPNDMIAQVHVSWLDPGKVRKITVVGSRKMIVYDDMERDKIAIYDKGVDRVPLSKDGVMDYDRFDKFQLLHRSGEVVLPQIDFQEPLKIEAEHFLDCVRTGSEPLTGPDHAVDVVRILSAGDQAIRNQRPTGVFQPLRRAA